MAELDLHPAECCRRIRCAQGLRQGRACAVRFQAGLGLSTDPWFDGRGFLARVPACIARRSAPSARSTKMSIDYAQKIPNNVNLSEDRALQRALEHWQPNYLEWWREMGPEGSKDFDVYLRTAVSVDPSGWAHFDYLKMPDYRWGIFLAPPDPARQDVPGEHRANLRRIIVTQGDTEPASVEQQRHLGRTAPSMYDLRNLFQI